MKATRPLESFQQLGADVEQRWRARGYALSAFPAITAAALADHALPERIEHLDLVRDAVRSPLLPRQFGSDFGQPPLNVYLGSRFYIEVLTWVDSTTAIHQHNFSGAFQVLAGSSLHTRHSFTERERHGNRLLVGDTRFLQAEHLTRGAIREIHSGHALIHALFHLDRPSATIVVRTDEDGTGPQYNYEKPYLAIDPFHVSEPFRTHARLLHLLASLNDPGFVPTLGEALQASDAWSAYRLLDLANKNLTEPQAMEPLLALVRERHGALADAMRPCLAEARRQANIKLRRDRVRDAEHRYLLALLLNLPSREAILALVRSRYPQLDPVTWVVSQVRTLAQQDQIGLSFDAVSLAALEGLLRDQADEHILQSLGARFGQSSVQSKRDALGKLFDEIRAALLLQPLFVYGSRPNEFG